MCDGAALCGPAITNPNAPMHPFRWALTMARNVALAVAAACTLVLDALGGLV